MFRHRGAILKELQKKGIQTQNASLGYAKL